MTGKQKLEQTAQKLKADIDKEKERDEKNLSVARASIANISQNSELAQLYNSAATIGTENLGGGELPVLKIHSVGKSQNNELSDGNEPQDGYFFYKPDGSQYGGIEAHILTVSRGFYAPAIEEGKDPVFNQILGGVIRDSGEYKPFIFYLTGKKLQPWWEFAKTINKYTKKKPVAVPMFALPIKMTTSKSPTEKYGKVWIVDFELVKGEDKEPLSVSDIGEFTYLRDMAQTLDEMIAGFVNNREIKKDTTQVVESTYTQESEVKESQDMPF